MRNIIYLRVYISFNSKFQVILKIHAFLFIFTIWVIVGQQHHNICDIIELPFLDLDVRAMPVANVKRTTKNREL